MTLSRPIAAETVRAPTGWGLAAAVLVGGALLRLAFSAVIPLFPDETYYWDWSRHLAAGYFDHPWGIAALIHGGVWLSSHLGLALSPLAVRSLVSVAGFVAALSGAAIAHRLGGGRAAFMAAVLFTVMPLAASGLVLATPDVPLLATVAVGLYALVRAFEQRPSSVQSLTWWVAAGIAVGLAFSSKYTSILLPVGVVIAMVTRPGLRIRLREPGPYVACVVATLVFLPVLWWNAHNGWISFGFQLNHGLGVAKGSALSRELNLLGGQAGLATPIVLVMLAIAVWQSVRRPASDLHYLLAIVALTCAGLFVFSALRRPVEANWPALAYVPAIPLLALTDWKSAGRKWLWWGIALAGVVSAVIYAQSVYPILPLRASRDPVARSAGWTQLADSVEVARRALLVDSAHVWVAADRYQDASELAFHLPDHPVAFSTNLSGRSNQYDLWPGFAQMAHVGDDLVIVLDASPQPHHTAVVLAPYFESMGKGALVPLQRRDGGVVTQRRIWVFQGWNGGWPGGR